MSRGHIDGNDADDVRLLIFRSPTDVSLCNDVVVRYRHEFALYFLALPNTNTVGRDAIFVPKTWHFPFIVCLYNCRIHSHFMGCNAASILLHVVKDQLFLTLSF